MVVANGKIDEFINYGEDEELEYPPAELGLITNSENKDRIGIDPKMQYYIGQSFC